MYKLVIFDYDGTIMDTLDSFYIVAQEMQRRYGKHTFSTKEELRNILDLGVSGIIKQQKIPWYRIPFMLRFLQKSLDRSSPKLMHPYTGILPMLKSVKVPKYIVTSNFATAVLSQLYYHKLDGQFKGIMGLHERFSKVAKIKDVCSREGCSPRECIFVSDTSSDIVEGKKSGAFTIAVRYGYGNSDRLSGAHPDFFVETPEELSKKLVELLNKKI